MERRTIGTSGQSANEHFVVLGIEPLRQVGTRPIPGARMRYDVTVARGGESSLYMSFGCWDNQGRYYQSALTLLAVAGYNDGFKQTTEFASLNGGGVGQFDSYLPEDTHEREFTLVREAIQERRIGAPGTPPANPGQPPRLSHF